MGRNHQRLGREVGGHQMTQSRAMSATETIASTAIGFIVAMLAQKIILPLFGLHASNSDHFWIAVLFTFVSIVRGYCVRRLFNWIGESGK